MNIFSTIETFEAKKMSKAFLSGFQFESILFHRLNHYKSRLPTPPHPSDLNFWVSKATKIKF